MNRFPALLVAMLFCSLALASPTLWPDLSSMAMLSDGETKMVNALWIENPPELRMGEGRDRVLVADLKGPGVITMLHFAMPATLSLNRGVTLRMWWDGETNPSVECPLVDFFCDPNGALDSVNTALVNKRRGWNAYFVMPFAKSARIEIAADNPRYKATFERNPCYSYVMYRSLKKLPKHAAYFHAQWHQQTLLMGKEDYPVFDAVGQGQFIGWNMTIRAPLPQGGYPVDENENFFIDGETEPSISWQGLEDSFGFSWGFPETANTFPLTGWQPFYQNGAAAYRFCLNDRISFRKTLRMTVGFGKNESPMFREMFSKPENPLELSSVAYWYQTEPHKSMPPLPAANDRLPMPARSETFHDADKHIAAGETVAIDCGRKAGDVAYLAQGWDFQVGRGFEYEGFPSEVKHCWADEKSLEFDLLCPKGAAGTLRLFIIDGDNFMGGRSESVCVAGRMIGSYQNFQKGQWIEAPIKPEDTAGGRIPVVVKNLRDNANAVLSMIRFVAAK